MKLRNTRPFLDQVVQLLEAQGGPARGMALAAAIEPNAPRTRLHALSNEIRRLATTEEGGKLIVRTERGCYATRRWTQMRRLEERAARDAVKAGRPTAALIPFQTDPPHVDTCGMAGVTAPLLNRPSPLNVALVCTTLDNVLRQVRAGAAMAPLADQVALAAALMRASA